ncbi:MAG: nickel-dependent lactate racemase [Pyrinomonadaceae bacterium]
MKQIINLAYGKGKTEFAFNADRFNVLSGKTIDENPLSDAEINAALDAPIDSDPLETVIEAGDTVLIIVPDATRQAASGQIVNLLVRRLIANGVMPFDIRIIFATGIHRQITIEEKRELITPFIFQRVKTLDHNPRDLVQLVNLGTTQRGTTIELNRALVEHDKIILVGGVSFHYFAGFGGGRKLICPGLASSRTANETHKITFDFEKKRRRNGVETAKLAGNPVAEEFLEIAAKINPVFAVNTIVNAMGNAVKIFAGNWRTSHEAACEYYLQTHSITITEKRPLVIVSSGGAPFDLNLIQAHKALEMASRGCIDGGTIVWLAECVEGLGRNDFLNWFEAENSEKLAENLEKKFQVNGQTAWSLLEKAERFRILLISNLPEDVVLQMQIHPSQNLNQALSQIDKSAKGYILPFGANLLPRLN